MWLQVQQPRVAGHEIGSKGLHGEAGGNERPAVRGHGHCPPGHATRNPGGLPPMSLVGVLFQYAIDRSSGFSVVVAEDSSQPFLSNDRP